MIARLAGLASSASLALGFTGSYLIDPMWWSRVSDGGPLVHRQSVESFELFTRSSFLVGVFGSFENSCRILLRHISPEMPGLAEAPVREVVKVLRERLPSVPPGAWTVVDLLRLTRNSAHNNWIVYDSKRPAVEVTHDGSVYRFEHGKPIEFATWAFITARFIELGDLSCRIVSEPLMAGFPVIFDPAYAPESAAADTT